jgi:hypothetical protein
MTASVRLVNKITGCESQGACRQDEINFRQTASRKKTSSCHLRQEDDTETPYRKHCNQSLAYYIGTHSLFKSGSLSTNIKLTLYKALIRSLTIYACPTCENAVDAHLLKLQCLQNRVLRVIGNLNRCTQVRELNVAFKVPNVYDYITKLCRTQDKVLLNHVNPIRRGIGQGEARHRRLKLGGGQAYDRSADKLHFQSGYIY